MATRPGSGQPRSDRKAGRTMSPLGKLLVLVACGAVLLGRSGPRALAGAEGPRVKATAKPPDAAEINRLIARLGSRAYADREAASRALTAVGQPALALLRKA